jgi:hypothetical protein
MNDMEVKIDNARGALATYEAAYVAGDKPAARNAAYELVKLACQLHSAADPGAQGKVGSAA